MLKKFLAKIEERFVFNVSQYFWHVIIAFISLGMVAGILLLAWSIIPAGKATVEKEIYPQLVKATYDEVNNAVMGKRIEAKPEVIQKTETKPEAKEKYQTEGQPQYEKTLDTLKQLIPPTKYAWEPKGEWYYPYGQNYPQYREWRETEKGIYKLLEETYSIVSAYDFPSKTNLLSAIIVFVKPYKDENRVISLSMGVNTCTESVGKSISVLMKLKKVCSLFSEDNLSYLSTLSYFIRNNRSEGEKFLEMTASVLPSFDKNFRDNALSVLVNNFYNHFNNRIELQIEQTNYFLTFIKKFEIKNQPEALDKFYQISVIRNRNRDREINRIENEYSQKMMQAEAEYLSKHAEKVEYRVKGLYGVVAGIVSIAFVALLLVMLSMQRYLKNIDQKLAKTTT